MKLININMLMKGCIIIMDIICKVLVMIVYFVKFILIFKFVFLNGFLKLCVWYFYIFRMWKKVIKWWEKILNGIIKNVNGWILIKNNGKYIIFF